MKHAGFGGNTAHPLETAGDLPMYNAGRDGMDREDPSGIFSHNTCDGGHAIDTVRSECLEIRLETGAPAAIGTGDRQCDWKRSYHKAPAPRSMASICS